MEKDAADIMLAQGIYTVNVWVNVLASPPNQNFHLFWQFLTKLFASNACQLSCNKILNIFYECNNQYVRMSKLAWCYEYYRNC